MMFCVIFGKGFVQGGRFCIDSRIVHFGRKGKRGNPCDKIK